ncbi:3-oxoacyl-[acyl-carrier-protein] reductase [Abditibacterium utsteinense]|uniref:3-oxoacyl-[acyl-carrier-protein] reductase n=1 Tax=Abditibacterium utsteinense TaxID=1960156 RepID=A0A2S8SVG1_9BACT|nr:3-oxoacyl-[acyl-carrier-protein] reductase [Abditibacterium utsteinense]PQV64783.1 3-oxoacyl-[acyl-carrier-protein] reductase [Abditibacterium utsteinense]
MQLENQVAFITGARRGIGRAIALKFAQNGADCVLLARTAPDELAQEIRALGRRASALAVDVSDALAVEKAVKEAAKEFGRIDILVNNAGINDDGLLIRMKLEQWQRVLDVNLSGAFYATKAAARPMLKQESGRIINITSVIGQMGNAGQANYAASKAGLIGFTKSVAKELGSRGITVNAIAPGFIETDMTHDLSEEAKTALLGQIPLGKLGQAEDVAELALFLASGGARYITGQTFNVDGGLVME